MKFENCKAASSEIQVEGMRSVTSVRDAANRLSRTKYMASEVIVKYNDLFNMQIGNLLGGMKATLDTLPESYAMHQKLMREFSFAFYRCIRIKRTIWRQ